MSVSPRAQLAPSEPKASLAGDDDGATRSSHPFPPCDLLHAEPRERLDFPRIVSLLRIAFVSGGMSGALDDVLTRAEIVKSEWDAATFAPDIYFEELVAQLGEPSIANERLTLDVAHFARLLVAPPPATDGAFRHAVFAELLERPAYVSDLVRVHRALRRLRALLGGAAEGARFELDLRCLDTLSAVRDVFVALARGFDGAQSGLSRMRALGERVTASAAFVRLVALLEYEEKRATIDVRIGVSYDGRLRRFEVTRITEETGNPFHMSSWQRWWQRISLWLRGYRVSEREVLVHALDDMFGGVVEEVARLTQLLGDVEFYLAGVGFAERVKARGLAVCLPTFDAGKSRRWRALFNPLLAREGQRVVPTNLELAAPWGTVIVTGPNSGGKTRLFEALGIAQLFAQVGFPVPAAEANLVRAPGMLASIRELVVADHREGRLGTELLRVRHVFEKMSPGSFLLLDELCSGTNPVEADEIFCVVLDLLRTLEPQVFVSTHFLELAARLARERPEGELTFLQVELDAEQRPTYQLVPGVASTSLARETARRLGVTRAELLSLVEQAQERGTQR